MPSTADEDERDPVDLAALFARTRLSFVRLAVLLVDRRDLAEELVQEAFERVERAVQQGRVRENERLEAYVRTTVLNLCRMEVRRRVRLRRRARQVAWPADAEVVADHAGEPLLLREDQRAVLAAVRTLPVRQRQALVLRYWDGLSDREVAEALGVSLGTAKQHLHRGLAAVRRRLGGDDG